MGSRSRSHGRIILAIGDVAAFLVIALFGLLYIVARSLYNRAVLSAHLLINSLLRPHIGTIEEEVHVNAPVDVLTELVNLLTLQAIHSNQRATIDWTLPVQWSDINFKTQLIAHFCGYLEWCGSSGYVLDGYRIERVNQREAKLIHHFHVGGLLHGALIRLVVGDVSQYLHYSTFAIKERSEIGHLKSGYHVDS